MMLIFNDVVVDERQFTCVVSLSVGGLLVFVLLSAAAAVSASGSWSAFLRACTQKAACKSASLCSITTLGKK